MITQIQNFEELTNEAASYLRILCYSELSVKRFRIIWQDLNIYIQEHKIQCYDGHVGIQYLVDKSQDVEYQLLSRREKRRIRAIAILSDFQKEGIIRKKRKAVSAAALDGLIGNLMREYIAHLKQACNLEPQTIKASTRQLSVFLNYLNIREIQSLDGLNQSCLINFVNSLDGYSIESKHTTLLKVKQFLKYLKGRQILPIQYSELITSYKFTKQRRLPSYYSREEICRLIEGIDKANPTGKRDYAMILLAARLGLRSSDIIGLRFDEISWDRQLVILNQKKTKETIELPLLEDVGAAIISYLKYGRPESELSSVFLCHKAPFDAMQISNLNAILKKYMVRSGISFDERRHGPHSLRHSLATNLLTIETPLPVISGVLGHINQQSTMCYLKVDINSLRKCALPVAAVSIDTDQVNKKEGDK